MDQIISQMTVCFEDPFWVGISECSCRGIYEVSRIVFGAKPKEEEVYDLIIRKYRKFYYGSCLETEPAAVRRENPKRAQRAAKRQMQPNGIGTKAQQALQLLREQNKQVRKSRTKAQREAVKEKRFLLHEQKRREKHRGH